MFLSNLNGEEVNQRLLQGTYDDAVKAGFTGTKAEFDAKLKKLLENSDNLTGIVPVERGGRGGTGVKIENNPDENTGTSVSGESNAV